MTRLSAIIVLFVALAMSHPGSAGEDIVNDNNGTLQKINESLSKYKEDLAGTDSITPTHAEWEIHKDIRYEYYALEGNTLPEMIESIGRVGPLSDHLGNRAVGQTQLKIQKTYHYRYDYKFYNNQRSAVVSIYIYDIYVNPEITVTLPVIQDTGRLSEREAQWWNTYSSCIAEHENDHVGIIKETFPVEEIKKEIRSITSVDLDVSPSDDIEERIKNKIYSTVNGVISKWDNEVSHRNNSYDALVDCDKRHGLRSTYFDELK